MKKVLYSIALMMVAVFSSVLLTACGDPEPTKLEIVAASVENPTLVNQPHDLSGLKVVVTYDNGDRKTVSKNNDMTITPINVNQLGEQTLTVKYLGLTATLKIEVVPTEGDLYKILGFDKPQFQTDWAFARLQHNDNDATADFDERELTFADRTQSYKVGDENPFVYLPIITAVDEEGDDIVIGSYTSKVVVEQKNGSTYTKLEGTALTDAVAVDNTKSSFDFTQAAVGNVYRITVEPEDNPNDVAPLSIEVEVVDGYNVHTVAELSAMDNNPKAVDDWAEYKAANGITQTAQDGIVLHGNFKITANDIPKSYVYHYNPNGENTDGATEANDGTLKYKQSIYCRDAQTAFTIYGNYFTVDASKMPYSHESDYEDEFGHTYIFAFGGDDHECPDTRQAAGSKVESIYMIGNANKNDETLARGGINGIITSAETLEINNMVSRAFLTHVNTVDSIASTPAKNPISYPVKTTINNSHMYDSYSMMCFGWGEVTIELNNVEFKRAGGPTVIATQVVERTDIKDEHGNKTGENVTGYRPSTVTVNGGTTQSYLAGTEGWFDLTPGAGTAVQTQILPLSGIIHETTTKLAAGLNAYFEDNKLPLVMPVKKLTTNDGGVEKLNLVSLLLSNADNPVASPYPLSSVVTINNGSTVACNNDPSGKVAPVYTALNAATENAFAAAPFFEANGVVMTTNMKTFYVVKGSNFYDIQNEAQLMQVAEEVVTFFSAPYMNLYMGGTGLSCVLEMFDAAPLPLE